MNEALLVLVSVYRKESFVRSWALDQRNGAGAAYKAHYLG